MEVQNFISVLADRTQMDARSRPVQIQDFLPFLRFSTIQPNRKEIPIRKAKNGSIRKVTLIRLTGLPRSALQGQKFPLTH